MVGVDTRDVARSSLFMLTRITLENNSRQYQVKVRNLSPKGMMAEGNVPVARGSRLSINLENGTTVEGTVAWIEGSRFGIAFDGTADMADFRRSAAKAKHEVPRHLSPRRKAQGNLRKV